MMAKEIKEKEMEATKEMSSFSVLFLCFQHSTFNNGEKRKKYESLAQR